MTNRKSRDSGIEMLRIILMMFIIWGHCLSQSSLTENMNLDLQIVRLGMGSLARIATACYMVITCWFINVETDGTKILRRACRLYIQYICACVLVMFMFWKWMPRIYLIKVFFPLTWNPLWYVTCYIMLLVILPFVNIGLRQISSKQRKYFSILVFIAFYGTNTMFPILNFGVFPNENLYEELLAFIVMYIVVQAFREEITNMKTPIFIGGGIISVAVFTIVQYANLAMGQWGLLSQFASNFFAQIGMVPCFLVAICLVIPFTRIHFHCTVLNSMAKGTMCAYIFHQMPSLYPHLWDEIFRVNACASRSIVFFVGYLFFVAIVILLMGIVLEIISFFVTKFIMSRLKSISRCITQRLKS